MGAPNNDTYSYTYMLPRLNDFENKRINYAVLHAPRFEVYNVYDLPSQPSNFIPWIYEMLREYHHFIRL